MPSHLHAIIIIEDDVKTRRGESLRPNQDALYGKPVKNSLSVIVNQFKGAVTRWANANNYEYFSWQPRFFDRIIRNEKELYNIRTYIEQNPLRWDFKNENDEFIFAN